MNALFSVPTYTPSPPWTDGQVVTRNTDGVRFIYSKSLNALTVDPNHSGIAKNAGGFIVSNLPTPTNPGDAVNKAYVDAGGGGGGGGIPEAPTDGGTYARQSLAWVNTYDGGAY